jgi:hypothetical protein
MFCFDFDRIVHLESLAILGIGGCNCRLLRRFTGTGEGCGCTVSTPEDNSRLPEDIFCKMFGRC